MARLIAYRLATGVLLLLVVSFMTFALVALIPGDPAADILGSSASPSQYAALDASLHLNAPLFVQYGDWLGNAVQGNLGTSLTTSQSVVSVLNAGLVVTLPLVIGATLIGSVLGIAFGVLAATRGRVLARMLDILALIGLSTPNFWIALVLVEYVLAPAVTHGILPNQSYVPFSSSPTQWFGTLLLPMIALAVAGVAAVAKQTRDAVDDVLGRPYIEALRVDGIPARRILFRHVLRNAAIPVVAVIGGQFVGALGATVIIENIFALPGLGRTVIEDTSSHDLPVVAGAAVYFCALVVIVNLLVDLAYRALNPRAAVAA